MADQYEPQNGAEDYANAGDAYAQGDYGQTEEQVEQAAAIDESPGDKINASKNDDDERYGVRVPASAPPFCVFMNNLCMRR